VSVRSRYDFYYERSYIKGRNYNGSSSNSPLEIEDSTTPIKYKLELEGLGVCFYKLLLLLRFINNVNGLFCFKSCRITIKNRLDVTN
jgi:hypothetical protein